MPVDIAAVIQQAKAEFYDRGLTRPSDIALLLGDLSAVTDEVRERFIALLAQGDLPAGPWDNLQRWRAELRLMEEAVAVADPDDRAEIERDVTLPLFFNTDLGPPKVAEPFILMNQAEVAEDFADDAVERFLQALSESADERWDDLQRAAGAAGQVVGAFLEPIQRPLSIVALVALGAAATVGGILLLRHLPARRQ